MVLVRPLPTLAIHGMAVSDAMERWVFVLTGSKKLVTFLSELRLLRLFLLLFATVQWCPAQDAQSAIIWHPWSPQIFAQAAREHKLVLVELGSIWCHWCHVMDEETYSDPTVRGLIEKNYLALKVDESERPDISNRYYGNDLPATLMFKADGSEIIKQQGYIPPRQMASILQAVVDDPSPGPSVKPEPNITYATSPNFPSDLLATLRKTFKTQYDVPAQGWAFGVKYIDEDSVEYASALALRGDALQGQQVRDSLTAAQGLLDPVWGGTYQSLVLSQKPGGATSAAQFARIQVAGRLDSTGESWNEPHFEKPLATQAQATRIYSQAYAQWHRPEYLAAAQNIQGYIRHFLTSPDGGFYVGQDGEVVGAKDSVSYFALGDAKRRALGIPGIDKHLYARENGWMIEALCELYAVTGDAATLEDAERSAHWIIIHRAMPQGGFSHDRHNSAGPYLGDTLAAGQAFLALYEVTGDREWLKRATTANQFISANFSAKSGAGFVTSKTSTDPAYTPHPNRDENAQLARFANLLARYTGKKSDEDIASRAMRYLATQEIATADFSAPVLLAEMQFTHAPLHVTVVGGKGDEAARSLFRAALSGGLVYKRLEWWDPAEGPLSRPDIQYPALAHAAGFLCTAYTCSAPISDPKVLRSLSAKTAE